LHSPSKLSDSEDLSLRPEKVKSRWRRNSELESVSCSVSSSDYNLAVSTTEKEQSQNDNFILDCSEEIPHYVRIEENIYLFER